MITIILCGNLHAFAGQNAPLCGWFKGLIFSFSFYLVHRQLAKGCLLSVAFRDLQD